MVRRMEPPCMFILKKTFPAGPRVTCLHSTCSKQLQVQNRYPLLKHMCPPPPDRIKYVQGRARPPPSSSFSYSDCLATPSFNMPYAGSCYPAAAGCLPSSQTPVRHHVIRLPQPRRVNVLRVLLAYIQGLRGTSSFPQKNSIRGSHADYANRDAPQLQIAWKLKEQPLIWLCFLSFLQSVILLSPSFVPDGVLACILNGRVSLSPVAPAALEEAFVSSSKSRPYKVSPGSGSSALTTARPLESLMPTAWQPFPPTGHYLVDDLHLIQYHAGTDLQRATRASRNRRNRPIEP